MTTYNPDLVCKLWEIFPDSFSISKTYVNVDYRPGQFGFEEAPTEQYETVTLAECILNTAQAISRGGRYMDQAIKYLYEYKPAKVQRREIASYLR